MMEAQGKVKSAEISAVITRADGTIEDLGVISRMEPEPEPDEAEQTKEK